MTHPNGCSSFAAWLVAVAASLGAPFISEVFVNGKPLGRFGPDKLLELVSSEVENIQNP